MARPTKLSDEVEERILKAIRIGNHITVAAQYAGIHPATFYRWMNGDPDASDKRNLRYRRFRERVAQARAEAEVRHVSLIAKAGERQWRVAAFLLERGSPERWGKASLSPAGTQQGTASEPPSAPGWPPGFHHSRLSAEEQEQLLELLNR